VPLTAYEETIPETTVSFRMIPISALAGASDERSFWIAATEVTWDQYDLFVYGQDAAQSSITEKADAITRPSKPYLPPDRGFGHAGFPAISMSHHAAQEFCKWLSAKTGKDYRVPTEAQWQRACDTGSDSSPSLAERAWFAANAKDKTHAVATKAADANGVVDMLGNAAEWCTAADGAHVARGGSFRDDAADVSCAARVLESPNWNASDPQLPKSQWWLADCPFVGFRMVCIPREHGKEGDVR
jgi:formylglycine-generating enzyme required for sulfatase activity